MFSHFQITAQVSCDFHPVRKGDVALGEEEIVEIMAVKDSRALIRTKKGSIGTVPVSFLEPADLPGETLVEQIEYRRMWLSEVDGTRKILPLEAAPKTSGRPTVDDGRPEFILGLKDVRVREGDRLELRPIVSSPIAFSLTWRGPALEGRRGIVENDQGQSYVVIPSVVPCDAGPYSVVAENEYGITSTVALISVAVKPASPVNVFLRRTGPFSLRIQWTPLTGAVRYGIEARREESNVFFSVTTGLSSNKFSIRGFHPAKYILRVYSYNTDFRSKPSDEVSMDFGVPFLDAGSSSSLEAERTPFSRSESI